MNYAFKENAFMLHHKIVIFHGFFAVCLFVFFLVIFNLCYLFWQTGSKMVSCSLQFDESSDDDLEKLMTPSSKRKLDLSHVSHMSHMSIASPMQEYVSPCFQVRQQQIMSLFYVPWIISLKDRHPTVRNLKKTTTHLKISIRKLLAKMIRTEDVCGFFVVVFFLSLSKIVSMGSELFAL